MSLDDELPTDPTVAYSGEGPIIGCNHLVCARCGVVVRRVDGRFTKDHDGPPASVLAVLYGSVDPASSPHFNHAPIYKDSRVYLCRCECRAVALVKETSDIDAPWICGGHPDSAGDSPMQEAPAEVSADLIAAAKNAAEANVTIVNARRQQSIEEMLAVRQRGIQPWTGAPAAAAAAISHPATPEGPPEAAPGSSRVDEPPAVRPAAEAPNTTDSSVVLAPYRPRIKLWFVTPVNPEFGTASELRDALLASWPEAEHFHAPVVRLGGEETVPSWNWVIDFARTRSDWWPALGLALQHAVRDGGDLARTALADLLAGFQDSVVLLPWTAPIARQWPEAVSRGGKTAWNLPDLRLETIVREQTRALAELTASNSKVCLDGYGKDGKAIKGSLVSDADLRRQLGRTAHAGRFPGVGKGPWSWLGWELQVRRPALWPALIDFAYTADAADILLLFALLDWFSEQRDLWRFASLLEGWDGSPRWWRSDRADTRPRGWQDTMRTGGWRGEGVDTLGKVVREAWWEARHQAETPPVIDLPPLLMKDVHCLNHGP